jgi:hypothetical protein
MILGIVTVALAVGCAGGRGFNAPQAAELTQPVVPIVQPPPLGPESDIETQREIERRLPHGPADIRYREPVIGAANPELAVVTAGGLRMRTWECSWTSYSNGCVAHYPLWFEDPLETREMYSQCCDCLPGVYSPARFVANFIALPVTMVVHPCCERACTDRTAIFTPNGRVVPLTANQPLAGYRPCAVHQVP